MTRVYKPRVYKAIALIVGGGVFAFVLGMIALVISNNFLNIDDEMSEKIFVGVAALVFILSVWMSISTMRIRLELTDKLLTVYRGNRINTYDLTIHHFGTRTVNDGTQELIVYDEEGGQDVLDCSFLSETDFVSLQHHLGVVGEKQQAVKIQVKQKNKGE